MINKNIITFILGLIYLSDIYKLNSFELNDRNILIIILIIKILSKLNVIEGFSDTCFEGNDCSCLEDGVGGYQSDESNKRTLSKLKSSLRKLEHIVIDGDLTINGDAYFTTSPNIGTEIKFHDFNLTATNDSVMSFNKDTQKYVYWHGHLNTSSLYVANTDFSDYYQKVIDYINTKYPKAGGVPFTGTMTVRGNCHIRGNLSTYARRYEGQWKGGGLFTHTHMYVAGSNFCIWSTGIEYWRKCGSWWSAW